MFKTTIIKHLTLVVILWYINVLVVNGGKSKSKGSSDGAGEQVAIMEQEEILSQNYQGAVFIYPPGIRSERDIPVCPKWVSKQPEHEKDATEEMLGDVGAGIGVSGDFGFSNNTLTSHDILVTRRGSSNHPDPDQGVRWESACNVIHKRYFYQPIVERLCRCPERTECPWEWSQPPSYPNSPQNANKVNSTQPKGSRDPFTIMLSSRSQAKFCIEVSSALPKCQHQKKAETSAQKVPNKEFPNLIKTLRKVAGIDEVPKVKVNCFCPPLYRQWNYVGQEFANGTAETNYYYNCDRLSKCKTNDRCGNIRTDLHFSFYHCTCPRNHLCLPRVYPAESARDVEEDVNEVLFRGQIAPAFCTPFTQ